MNPRARLVVLVPCLALLAALAFGRALEAPFFWDDDALIVTNPWLGTPGGVPRFFLPAFWRGISFAEDYRPVEMLSYSLDHAFWRTRPAGFHLTNLLVHVFNCAALVTLAWLLFENAHAAALAGLLFAVHPMHSEPVVWIQNRSELLAAAFSLACMCAFLRWARDTRGGAGLYACALAAFALALLSKENAAILPLLLASLLAVAVPARRGAWRGLAPFLALAVLFAAVKLGLLSHSRPSPATALLAGAYPRLTVVATTLALYLGMLLFPARFCLDRLLKVPVLPPEAAPLLALAAISLVFAAAFRGLVRRRPWGVALALTLLPLLPASNIVFLSGRPLSEGRLYLASAGFCLGAALSIDRAARRPAARRLAAALAASLAAAWFVASAARTGYWLDERVLWERTLEASPFSWRTKLFLSRIYSREGRPDEAIGLIKGILRYSEPRPSMAFVDLGRAYGALGWSARARAAFERAAAAGPDNPVARLCLGEAYRLEGRFDEALREFEAVGRLRPDSGKGLLLAAGVFSARGDHAAALDALRRVIARHPGSVEALAAAAAAHAARGEDAEAERLFTEARSLDPSSPALLNNLGLFLERRGRLEEALAIYREAAEAGPDRWAPRYNAAVILEAQGRLAEAVVALMQAAALRPGHAGLRKEVGRLLDLTGNTRLDPGAWERIANAHAALLQAQGIYCARTGETKEAIGCFEALIALDPRNGEARANLARTLAERGEHRRALEEYRAAARLLPDSAAIQAGMGACYAEIGMRGEAEAAWARALRLDPHAREPRRNLSRLRRLR